MCQLRLTTCSRGKNRRWSKLQGWLELGVPGHLQPTLTREALGPNTDGGPRRWGPPHQPASTLRAAGPRVPPRSAPGAERAWPARANLEAAMASMVEYGDQGRLPLRLLQARRRARSCGEWSGQRGRRGRLASKPRHRPPRSRPGSSRGAAPRPHFPAPASSPRVSSPDRCPSHSVSRFHPYRDGGLFRRKSGIGRCSRSRWRRWLQRRGRSLARLACWRPGGAVHCGGGGGGFGVGFGWAGPRLGRLRGWGHGVLGRAFAQHRILRGRGLHRCGYCKNESGSRSNVSGWAGG